MSARSTRARFARAGAVTFTFAVLAGALAGAAGGCSSGNGASGADPSAGDAPPPSCNDAIGAEKCAALAAAKLPDALPPAAGNAHGDDFDAAVFGFHVFFDIRFSKGSTVRCETCHTVEDQFSDGKPVSTGLAVGVRNAPTIFNAARFRSFFWDGRADSLWSQPLFALENPSEMGFTRLEIVHLLSRLYAKEYATAFGPLPDVSDTTRFPLAGRPGDAAFDDMKTDDKNVVNGVVANLGKALEAFMRKTATGPSAFDRYLGGDATALDAEQVQGMYVFARSGCLDCHRGPQLSDGLYHNLGVPAADGEDPDPGRSAAIAVLESNPFNASGPFFDGGPDTTRAPEPAPVIGGFRTPSLRNLPKSAPYGHNGSLPTLESMVAFHLQGGGSDPTRFVGSVDPLLAPRTLSADDLAALVAFLRALEGEYPPLPWGQWPNGNG